MAAGRTHLPSRSARSRRVSATAPSLDSYDVLEELETLKRQDFAYEAGQILGSMCTAPHPLAVQAHLLFLEANLGDPGHFPGAKTIEDRYLQCLLDLAGSSPSSGGGQVTSGGSEANILALAMLRGANGGRNEVIVPRTGHFSLEKAAKFMRLKLRIAEVDDQYRVEPARVQELVGPKTAGIVGIAGSTQVGSIDPLPELGRLARDLNVPLHVDAAFGGYLLPFLHPARRFGFDLEGVTSVTMDSHKMGMATLGAGALLVNEPAHLDVLAVETPYLSVPRQRGVLGTRPAAPIAAAWALWAGLGRAGYRAVVEQCLSSTRHLVTLLNRVGLQPLVPPQLNIVAIPVHEPTRVQAGLTRRGWRVNVLPRLSALRIVCMPHVTPEVLDAFVPDLVEAIERHGGDAHGPQALAPAY